MRTTLSLILVAALASSAFAAQKYRYYGSSGSQSYQAHQKPSKSSVTEEEKKLAEAEKYDIKKMSEKLKNGAKK